MSGAQAGSGLHKPGMARGVGWAGAAEGRLSRHPLTEAAIEEDKEKELKERGQGGWPQSTLHVVVVRVLLVVGTEEGRTLCFSSVFHAFGLAARSVGKAYLAKLGFACRHQI